MPNAAHRSRVPVSILLALLVAACGETAPDPMGPRPGRGHGREHRGGSEPGSPGRDRHADGVRATRLGLPDGDVELVGLRRGNGRRFGCGDPFTSEAMSRSPRPVPADPSHSASVTLTVECPEPRELTGAMRADATWENWIPDPGCFDYVAPNFGPGSNDYTLTIEPGTVVGFGEGVAFRMRGVAALIADGTEEEPIVLTGMVPERGYWRGLSLEGVDHGRSVLDWVTVEHTGDTRLSGAQDASLILLEDAVVTITNSTFRESSGYGVHLSRQSRIVDPSGNAFTENALGPAYAVAEAVPGLNGATLTGNDSDVVVVHPGITLLGDFDWPRATYRILAGGRLGVNDGLLTLAPGTELRFEALQNLTIWDGGGLNAVGTAEDPIVFTGTEPIRGHWSGIAFVGSGHTMNRLEHAVVEYAGAEEVAGGVRERLSHRRGHRRSQQRDHPQHGAPPRGRVRPFGCARDTGLPDFTGNVLTANALGGRIRTRARRPLAPTDEQLLRQRQRRGRGRDRIRSHDGRTTPPGTIWACRTCCGTRSVRWLRSKRSSRCSRGSRSSWNRTSASPSTTEERCSPTVLRRTGYRSDRRAPPGEVSTSAAPPDRRPRTSPSAEEAARPGAESPKRRPSRSTPSRRTQRSWCWAKASALEGRTTP